MRTLRLIILSFLILLSGCASVPEGPRFSVVENESETAIVYVYRLYTPPYMRKPDIKVNDIMVAELPTDSYTVIRVKSGTYTFKTDWGFLDNLILSKSAKISVEAGKSYYINFAGKLGLIGTTATYGANVLSGELTSIPPELKNCSYIKPQVAVLGQH
jgi:hypothetical protein